MNHLFDLLITNSIGLFVFNDVNALLKQEKLILLNFEY